jgi:hypothetical protein
MAAHFGNKQQIGESNCCRIEQQQQYTQDNIRDVLRSSDAGTEAQATCICFFLFRIRLRASRSERSSADMNTRIVSAAKNIKESYTFTCAPPTQW